MILNKVDFYYFSPTGGTEKVGRAFCGSLAEETISVNLGSEHGLKETPESEVIVAAVPVFAGRVPALVSEKLKKLDGSGKKAVTLAVYGNRAYEDALLELNNILTACGFQVAASGAFIAQHSIAPEVGSGRPDEKDIKEINEFAEKVLEKLEKGAENELLVPGNYPYKPEMKVSAVPFSLPDCTLCGKCASVCPVGAVSRNEDGIRTNAEKCILCMACVHACPQKARVLPLPLQERMEKLLGRFKSVRNANEIFL